MDLHQVFLMTGDFDESFEFYSDALGLSVERERDGYVEFRTGTCSLVIERDFDEETLAGFGLEPPGERRGEGTIVVIEVDDVDETYERLMSHGISPLVEPREVSWGRKMFLVEDPDGYVLEISRPT